jgi:hypothetical protein
MRTRLLGTIAAVAAGAGGALGQAPPPPMPIGPAGGMGPGGMGVVPASGTADPIPPPIGQPGMGGDPLGGLGGPGMLGHPGMGGPMYPPPGPYGGQPWQDAFPSGHGGSAYGSRVAPRLYVEADYTLWFVPRQPVPGPLLTSGPPAGNGVLGAVGTVVRAGDRNLGYGVFSGFNIHVGGFHSQDRRWGWEIGGFMTELKTNETTVSSDATGQPLIARPFTNAQTGLPTTLLVSFPTYASGSATVLATARAYGAEASGLLNLFRTNPDTCSPTGCVWDANLLAGFRYLSVEEELSVNSTTNVLAGNTVPFDGKSYNGPVTIGVTDSFRTANRFYGGQLGLKSSVLCGRWLLASTVKCAIGNMHQEVTVDGFSSLANPTTLSGVSGGLYANSTNIGRYSNDEFVYIPEVNANLGYAWTSWLSTHVGYNFLYINRVARPGDQFTTTVNPAVVPTSFSYGLGAPVATPNPVLSQSEYWLQGVSFGLTVRY